MAPPRGLRASAWAAPKPRSPTSTCSPGCSTPATYLDGSLKLDAERSRKAVQAHIADPLGVGIDEALARMEEAYLQRLADALRTEEVAPDTVIAAFGGAGPMSVCGAARQAGVKHVFIPRTAAVFSAFGIGFSDISQTYEYPLTEAGAETLAEAIRELRLRGARDMYAEGVEAGDCAESLRLRIEHGVIDGRAGGDTVIDLSAVDDFAAVTAHLGDGDVASLELSLLAPLPHVVTGGGLDVAAQPAAPSGARVVRGRTGNAVELPVFTLLDQPCGAQGAGPAVIEGPFFTMRLPEGWQFQITAAGDLLLADTHPCLSPGLSLGATDARAHDRVPRDRPRHRTLAVPSLRPGPGPSGGQLQDRNPGPRP